jgi:hypothetical protein
MALFEIEIKGGAAIGLKEVVLELLEYYFCS